MENTNTKSKSSLVLSIIIVLALIIGAFYLYGKGYNMNNLSENKDNTEMTSQNNPLPLSDSDEIGAIEADLENTTIEEIEFE